MRITTSRAIVLSVLLLTGCVTANTHKETLAELETSRHAAAETDAAFKSFKEQSAKDMATLQAEKTALASQLNTAENNLARTRQELESVEATLTTTQSEKQKLEADLNTLRAENQDTQRIAAGLKDERDKLEIEKKELATQLKDERDKFEGEKKDLMTRLESEQAQTTALRKEKEQLLAGTTTAQEEIARLQKRAGELDVATAQLADLNKRLEEQDQQMSQLKQAVADREADRDALATKLAALGQERDQLATELQRQQERLKVGQADLARLEQERAAKEAEIQRLTKTHEDLTRSLEAEIAKGDIKIKQVRDRLTINMVDRVLFDSGQSHVKPAGLKVLKQVSDILKQVHDKQIRIEGHTDNVPIGVKLKDKFASNWELSTARATSVVRFLIDDGGVDRTSLSAIGYADTRPIASNDEEEGRTANRRIEIVLYPKDLSEIADQMKL